MQQTAVYDIPRLHLSVKDDIDDCAYAMVMPENVKTKTEMCIIGKHSFKTITFLCRK